MANKLFLGGIALQTQKEDLETHFGQFGTVVDSVVMYKDGRPRGFGFVTFAEAEAVDAVLSMPQVIHDRTIDVKRACAPEDAPPPKVVAAWGSPQASFAPAPQPAWGKGGFGGGYGGGCGGGCWGNGAGAYGGGGYKGDGGYGKGFAAKGAPGKPAGPKGGKGKPGFDGPTDKVFVGGLTPQTDDNALNAYFSRYGTLVDVVVMKDNMTQRSRGFGFVRYDNNDSVEQVCADYDNHEIDGKWVEVKKAVPQENGGKGKGNGMDKGGWQPMPQNQGMGGYGGNGMSYGKAGGGGCYGGKGYQPY